MAPPRKFTKRLELKVDTKLLEWLKSQVPEREASTQQVAISILEEEMERGPELARLREIARSGMDPRADIERLKAEHVRLQGQIQAIEAERDRCLQQITVQNTHIAELTNMLDRAIERSRSEGGAHLRVAESQEGYKGNLEPRQGADYREGERKD